MDVPRGDILLDTTPRAVPGIEGRFELEIGEPWRIFYAFGGATMAAAIRAAAAAVDRDDLHLISADATFCQAVPIGPVGVQVEVLRQGRSAAQALVRLWSLDAADPDPAGVVRTDLLVSCVFGRREARTFDFRGATPPEVDDPERYPSRATADPDSPFARIPYHAQTEFRPTGRPLSWGEEFPPGEPVSASWFRFVRTPLRPDGTWEPAALALPGDILGPAVHAGAGSAAGAFLVISLQISLQVIDEVRGDWLLAHTRAHAAGNGYASGTAELWDLERRLVATATQCAKVQPLKAG